MTGVDAPYERPEQPEVRTGTRTVAEVVSLLESTCLARDDRVVR